MSAPPRWATARTETRPTSGPVIAKVARGLGWDLMPWQRQVVDVLTERLPDGAWAYTDVTVTVPRQSGKTTLEGPVCIHRAQARPRSRVWYSAQTRQDARDVLVDEIGARFVGSPLRRLGKLRKSQGSEGIYFGNGSSYRVFAPSDDALHGKANELVVNDEVWVFDAVQGQGLAQAILPTFTTTGGQWLKLSTAGTADSIMLAEAVRRGRAAVDAGRDQTTAYFEWSLHDHHVEQVEAGLLIGEGPEFELALQLILDAHPGYGYTLNLSALRGAVAQMKPGEVLRAYGNRQTMVSEQVIPADRWAADRWPIGPGAPAWPRPEAPLALAFEVALGRTDAAILALWRDDAGRLLVDVIDSRPGDEWLPERLLELQQRWDPVASAHDSVGPVVDVADRAARLGVRCTSTTSAEMAASCEGILADIVDGRLRHRGQEALDDAVRAAAQRTIGEGWAWGRRKSAGSIAPLVAATAGRWVLDHAPEPTRPRFRAPR